MLSYIINKFLTFRYIFSSFLIASSVYLFSSSLVVIINKFDKINSIDSTDRDEELIVEGYLENNNLEINKIKYFDIQNFNNKHFDTIKNKITKVFLKNKDINISPIISKKKINVESVKIKKQKFIDKMMPLIIEENRLILADRKNLIRVYDYLINNKTLSKNDQKFIKDISESYFVKTSNRHKVDIIEELLNKVDIIPNSIVMAQAAIESGWGSSRFAKDHNAFFGQYTYDSKEGVIPNFREDGKKHLIKFFLTPQHSLKSYFNNINTHSAYKAFRSKRKFLRQNEKKIIQNIEILLNELDVYAQDKNYIKTINSIITINSLKEYDQKIYSSTLS